MGLTKGNILVFLFGIVSATILCDILYEKDFSLKIFSPATYGNVTARNKFGLNASQEQTDATPVNDWVSMPRGKPVSRVNSRSIDEITDKGYDSEPYKAQLLLGEMLPIAAEDKLDGIKIETQKAAPAPSVGLTKTGDAGNGIDEIAAVDLDARRDQDGLSDALARQYGEMHALDDVDRDISGNATATGGVGDGGDGGITIPREILVSGTRDLTDGNIDVGTNYTAYITNKSTNITAQTPSLEAHNLPPSRLNQTNINNTWLTVHSRGRLGNQMFQYAALYGLTRSNLTWRPYMATNDYSLLKSIFGQSLTLSGENSTPSNISRIKENNDADIMLEKLKALSAKNLSLYGFFQSHKFFGRYSQEIRREFTFTITEQDNVRRYFEEIIPPEWKGTNFTRVGIQVRRRNMVTPQRQRMGVIPSTPEYFQRAMDYFKNRYDKVQFIVGSDDMTWCKSNIQGPKVVYSKHGYQTDLAILSMCDHVIISVGTYSWWAGWLCKGTTVYHGLMPRNGTYMAKMYANNKWIPPDDEYQKWRPVT